MLMQLSLFIPPSKALMQMLSNAISTRNMQVRRFIVQFLENWKRI